MVKVKREKNFSPRKASVPGRAQECVRITLDVDKVKEGDKMGAGRPKKYTKKSLKDAVDKYFKSISCTHFAKDLSGEEIINDNGEKVKVTSFVIPPSITGLCLYLGIDRSTFQNYLERDRHLDLYPIATQAKARIEEYLERQLLTRDKGLQGIIFNLQNNYGWKDKKEIELGSETRESLDASKMSLSQKKALIREMSEKSCLMSLADEENEEDDE